MQDFGIPLLAGIIPIMTLLALALLLSQLFLHNLKFRNLFCGTPSLLIRNGEVQQEELRKNRYTLDELLEELRGQGISSIREVKYAVLENSGKLSVLPRSGAQPPTADRLGLEETDDVTLPVILINDGRILSRNLDGCGKDLSWLQQALKERQLSSPKEVFLLTLDEQGHVFCIKKEPMP
jgi:uncharacterized membrane protein YcaP (DUF421 family)